jgi:hypothetical protein
VSRVLPAAICLAWAAIPAPAMETLLLLKASKDVPRISEGDLVELADGRLAVVYTRFTGGGGDESAADLAMQTSADGGRTWSPMRILVRNEGKCNVMSVSLLRLKSGELLLFYLRKDSEATSCNLFVRRSRDELASVGDPVRVTSLDGYHVVNNDRVVQLSSGRLIVPAALHTGFDAAGKKVTPFVGQGVPIAYYSDDDGRTWKKDATAIPATNQRKLTLQENGVVELTDGRLWMTMRTAHGFQYGCYSTDRGQRWSEPQPTALASPCSPATIGRCPWSGQLVCVWNDYRGDHPFTPPNRTPLCLAASSDEGRTWGKSIVLESDPKGSFCYTSMTWGKDRLYLTYGTFSEWKVVAIAKDWLAAQLAAAQAGKLKRAEPPKEPLIAEAVDYGRSFINTKARWNSPRFWIESRLRITDPATKTPREYFQGGLCKSEFTFPARGMFQPDNYDFLPVFSQVDCVVFRRHITERGNYREVKPIAQAWGGTEMAVRHFRGRMLRNVEEISRAMASGKQLVGQTEIRDEKSGRVAVIEFPIKTINWQRDTGDWQVDTGPVLLPDLTVPPDQWSAKLRLAFVAFNAPDWAEFLVDEPTPVRENQKEVAKVYHYMRQVVGPVRNVILAQD